MFKAEKYKGILGLLDQGIISGTNFLLGLFIVNQFGLSSYGQYASVWLIYLFIASLLHSFITLPSMVLQSENYTREEIVFSNRKIRDRILIITTPAVFLLILFIYDLLLIEVIIYTFLIVAALRFDAQRKLFYALENSRHACFGSVIFFFSLSLFATSLWYIEVDGIKYLLIGLAFAFVLGGVYFELKIRKIRDVIRPRKIDSTLVNNWKYSKALLLTNILQWISGNFIQLAVLGILGTTSLGVLRMLQNILGLLHVIFLALENIVPAKGAQLLKTGEPKKYKTYLKKVLSHSALIFSLILLSLLIFPERVLSNIYSEDMIEYAFLLREFSFVYVLVFVGTWFQLILKINAKNNGILVAYIGSIIIGYLCAEPFVNRWGLSGAILTFGVLQIFTNSVYFFTIIKEKLI